MQSAEFLKNPGLIAKQTEAIKKQVSGLSIEERVRIEKFNVLNSVLTSYCGEGIVGRRKSSILRLIGFLDLTTLAGDDTPDKIQNLVEKAVNPLCNGDPSIHCAAVCVYPARVLDAVNFVKKCGGAGRIKVASVAGGFPSGQYRLETRLLEIKFAIEDGADEIDVVINRCAALTDQWQVVKDELICMKKMCDDQALLKTILSTGELVTFENIYKASWVAMEAGADFIKTSTGKEVENATLPVSFVMCQAIKLFYEKTGRKVGFKPAGGVKTTDEALAYFLLVRSILGDDWINPKFFRIGASSLLNDLTRDFV